MVPMIVIIFLDICIDNGILPCIKVRKNTKIRWKKGNIIRNLAIISQRKNNLQKWKDSVSYGQRLDC